MRWLTLTGIVVTDDNGTPDFPGDDFVVGTIPSLPPGGSVTFTRTVTLPSLICAITSGTQTGMLITEVLGDGNIKVIFIQSTGVNDNTYGVNSIGWGNKSTHLQEPHRQRPGRRSNSRMAPAKWCWNSRKITSAPLAPILRATAPWA